MGNTVICIIGNIITMMKFVLFEEEMRTYLGLCERKFLKRNVEKYFPVSNINI